MRNSTSNRKIPRLLLLFGMMLVAISAAGCSSAVFWKSVETGEETAEVDEAAEEAAAEPEDAESETAEAGTVRSGPVLSAVILRWQAPREPVLKYHLSYGYEPNNLSEYREVRIEELDQQQDPIHGPILSYVLNDVDADKTIYFTLEAENVYGRSKKTPVQHVDP